MREDVKMAGCSFHCDDARALSIGSLSTLCASLSALLPFPSPSSIYTSIPPLASPSAPPSLCPFPPLPTLHVFASASPALWGFVPNRALWLDLHRPSHEAFWLTSAEAWHSNACSHGWLVFPSCHARSSAMLQTAC